MTSAMDTVNHLDSLKKVQLIRGQTGIHLHIKQWESIDAFLINESDGMIMLTTYQVKDLVRETRYTAKGLRVITLHKSGRWKITDDHVLWDEEFEPWTFVKFGRIKTAAELEDEREWEKLCYRPGTKKTQLDSYERVCDPFFRSTDKMERHF